MNKNKVIFEDQQTHIDEAFFDLLNNIKVPDSQKIQNKEHLVAKEEILSLFRQVYPVIKENINVFKDIILYKNKGMKTVFDLKNQTIIKEKMNELISYFEILLKENFRESRYLEGYDLESFLNIELPKILTSLNPKFGSQKIDLEKKCIKKEINFKKEKKSAFHTHSIINSEIRINNEQIKERVEKGLNAYISSFEDDLKKELFIDQSNSINEIVDVLDAKVVETVKEKMKFMIIQKLLLDDLIYPSKKEKEQDNTVIEDMKEIILKIDKFHTFLKKRKTEIASNLKDYEKKEFYRVIAKESYKDLFPFLCTALDMINREVGPKETVIVYPLRFKNNNFVQNMEYEIDLSKKFNKGDNLDIYLYNFEEFVKNIANKKREKAKLENYFRYILGLLMYQYSEKHEDALVSFMKQLFLFETVNGKNIIINTLYQKAFESCESAFFKGRKKIDSKKMVESWKQWDERFKKDRQTMANFRSSFLKKIALLEDGFELSLYLSLSSEMLVEENDENDFMCGILKTKFNNKEFFIHENMYVTKNPISATNDNYFLKNLPIKINITFNKTFQKKEKEREVLFKSENCKVLPVILNYSGDPEYLCNTKDFLVLSEYQSIENGLLQYGFEVNTNIYLQRFLCSYIYFCLLKALINIFHNERDEHLYLALFQISKGNNSNSKNEYCNENFLYQLSKCFEHVFTSKNTTCASQNILYQTINGYKCKNAMQSLINEVEKKYFDSSFALQEPYGIVYVSSRICKQSKIFFGESYSFIPEGNSHSIRPFGTFCDIIRKEEATSAGLKQIVKDMTDVGTYNIVYIVKVPYSATIGIGRNDDQFYFNKNNLLALKDIKKDSIENVSKISIFPIFLSHFEMLVNKTDTQKGANVTNSYYINDVSQLRAKIAGGTNNIYPLFTITSNSSIGTKQDLKNFVSGYSYNGLNYSPKNKELFEIPKNNISDILEIILNFHFYKAQTVKKGNSNNAIKNPYSKIINDKNNIIDKFSLKNYDMVKKISNNDRYCYCINLYTFLNSLL